jgi:hypothetical protein
MAIPCFRKAQLMDVREIDSNAVRAPVRIPADRSLITSSYVLRGRDPAIIFRNQLAQTPLLAATRIEAYDSIPRSMRIPRDGDQRSELMSITIPK